MLLTCAATAKTLKFLPARVGRNIAKKFSEKPSKNCNTVKRRIFVDVSVFAVHDAGTGIQRVVREILKNIIKSENHFYTVIPVAATRKKGYRVTSVAFDDALATMASENHGQPVKLSKGDIFLGLDLAAHVLPSHYLQLLQWKCAGASIQVVVYDLLPVLHPEWFNPKSVKNYRKWIKALSIFSDHFHCISETVRTDLVKWFEQHYNIELHKSATSVFPLGSNLGRSPAETQTSFKLEIEHSVLDFCQHKPTLLMVGTIEPRKGHAEVLHAFADLWRQGDDPHLIFVGSPGWKTEQLQKQILDESAINNKLVWLRNADDHFLAQLYKSVSGVIIASKGEGYGLPLIEAAYYGKPVLARDIPVFREIAKGNVTFFSSDENSCLQANEVIRWLTSLNSTKNFTPNLDLPTWAESSRVLLENMGIANRREKTHELL